jgi:signal transduction histidine kinase
VQKPCLSHIDATEAIMQLDNLQVPDFLKHYRRIGWYFCLIALTFAAVANSLFAVSAVVDVEAHGSSTSQLLRSFGILIAGAGAWLFYKKQALVMQHYTLVASALLIAIWGVIVGVTITVTEARPTEYAALLSAAYLITFCTYAFIRLPFTFAILISSMGAIAVFLPILVSTVSIVGDQGLGNLRAVLYLIFFNVLGAWLQSNTLKRERALYMMSKTVLENKALTDLELGLLQQVHMRLRHDINQALAAVGVAIWFHRSSKNKEQRAKTLLTVEECHSSAIALVDALLEVSGASKDRMASLKFLDVNAIFSTAIALFEAQAAKADQRLICRFSLIGIKSDASVLLPVISNLLSNGIKYSSGAGRIYMYCVETDSAVSLVVADTGIGISEKDSLSIFELGYRVPSSNETVAGKGVGLYQVKQLIAMLDGHSIRTQRRRGRGTRFIIDIKKSEFKEE